MSENNADSVSETLLSAESTYKSNKVKRWIVILLIIIAIAIIYSFLNSGAETNYSYKTTKISRGDITLTVTAAGTLQPLNQVQVGSEISGLIEEVLVEANDFVKKGQVLAKINTDQLQAKLLQSQAALNLAKARLKEAEATVKETENNWLRKQELAKTDMCSREECDAAEASFLRAKASFASSKAQVFQAKAQVDADQTMLAKAAIRAPINGIVLLRNVEPGQTVAASFQTPVLFTLAEDLSHMQLYVDVDEADIGKVNRGQKASFTVDAYPQRRFKAEIIKVHFAPKIVQDVVTYEALLQVNNKELLLRPGMTATADIISQQISSALLVPNAALRFIPPLSNNNQKQSGTSVIRTILPGPPPRTPKQRKAADNKDGNKRVWIIENNEPTPVSIMTGITNGRSSEIISGDIKEGTEVIIDAIRMKK